MVGGGDPIHLKFWVNRPLLQWNRRFWTDIFAHSASAIIPSEKSSVNTNRKSTMRFPMSLRWSSYVAPKRQRWGSKTQNSSFRCIITLRLKRVCYKVSFCENCQRQSCKAFIGLSVQKWLVGATPCTWNLGSNWPRWSEIGDFQSIFARSTSVVTPSEKVPLTLRGSPLCAFQWAQDEHRTSYPQRGAQKCNVSKIWTSRNYSETIRDRMSVTINHY